MTHEETITITVWNEDLGIAMDYVIPKDVHDYIISLEGEVCDLNDDLDLCEVEIKLVKDAFSELAVAYNRNMQPLDSLHIN